MADSWHGPPWSCGDRQRRLHGSHRARPFLFACIYVSLCCQKVELYSLIPRPFEEEEKGPSTYCVRMRYFPSKSWKFIFLSAYLSVNVNLDLRYIPKNHFCWQRFELKMPVVTNLAIISEQHRQKNNKEAMRRTSIHV